MNDGTPHKKVGIVFFGLTRSLGRVINSIKTNLFDSLTSNNMSYDIFVHTYKINGLYTNMWSKESTNNYINEDVYGLLKPKVYLEDDQQDIINEHNFNDYYSNLGDWNGQMTPEMTKQVIRNMVLALYSKKRIMEVFQAYKSKYDYVIIMRPDTELIYKFVPQLMYELTDNNVILPNMHWFNGCNDRIIIATPTVALYCGLLYNQLLEYSTKKSIISEKYFMDMLNKEKIGIVARDIPYNTIRMDGSIW